MGTESQGQIDDGVCRLRAVEVALCSVRQSPVGWVPATLGMGIDVYIRFSSILSTIPLCSRHSDYASCF